MNNNPICSENISKLPLTNDKNSLSETLLETIRKISEINERCASFSKEAIYLIKENNFILIQYFDLLEKIVNKNEKHIDVNNVDLLIEFGIFLVELLKNQKQALNEQIQQKLFLIFEELPDIYIRDKEHYENCLEEAKHILIKAQQQSELEKNSDPINNSTSNFIVISNTNSAISIDTAPSSSCFPLCRFFTWNKGKNHSEDTKTRIIATSSIGGP